MAGRIYLMGLRGISLCFWLRSLRRLTNRVPVSPRPYRLRSATRSRYRGDPACHPSDPIRQRTLEEGAQCGRSIRDGGDPGCRYER